MIINSGHAAHYRYLTLAGLGKLYLEARLKSKLDKGSCKKILYLPGAILLKKVSAVYLQQ
jgi:hypothetical protein